VTRKDIDDAATVDTLLSQVADPVTLFTADGRYDQDRVSQAVGEHDPDAAIIVPPRAGAVANASAETAPTQRDGRLRMIAEPGRMAPQKASGYDLWAKVEASIGRYKRVIGETLRSRTDQTEATEVALAVAALNRMLGLGRPSSETDRHSWSPPNVASIPSTSPQPATYPTGRAALFIMPQSMDGPLLRGLALAGFDGPTNIGRPRGDGDHQEVAGSKHRWSRHQGPR
jgi:hypothetical protein